MNHLRTRHRLERANAGERGQRRAVGDQLRVYYDPNDPRVIELERDLGYVILLLFALVGLMFFISFMNYRMYENA